MHDSKLEDPIEHDGEEVVVRAPVTQKDRERIAELRAEGKIPVLASDDMVE